MANDPSSWLRDDCVAFYQNELLPATGCVQVKERLGLLRLGIDRAMALKQPQRYPHAQFLEFGVHEGKDIVRMATFLHSIEEKLFQQRRRRKHHHQQQKTNNHNNKSQKKSIGDNNTAHISDNTNNNTNNNKNNNTYSMDDKYTTFHGFDSFEGLPEDWINGQTTTNTTTSIGSLDNNDNDKDNNKPVPLSSVPTLFVSRHKQGAFAIPGGQAPDINNLVNHRLQLRNHDRNNNNSNSNLTTTTVTNTDTVNTSAVVSLSSFRGEGGVPTMTPAGRKLDNIKFHKGWFHETVPLFLKDSQPAHSPVAFVHADADLYTSTYTFLQELCHRNLFKKGSVIVFDEYWNYPNWQQGEYKAWMEITHEYQIKFQYFGYHAPHPTKKQKFYGYQSVGVVVTKDM